MLGASLRVFEAAWRPGAMRQRHTCGAQRQLPSRSPAGQLQSALRSNMHACVLCEGRVENSPVRALDISKRLIDYGFHPPTNYFPLIVREALIISPPRPRPSQRSMPSSSLCSGSRRRARTPSSCALHPISRPRVGLTRLRPRASWSSLIAAREGDDHDKAKARTKPLARSEALHLVGLFRTPFRTGQC
jgi:hypothetical protein